MDKKLTLTSLIDMARSAGMQKSQFNGEVFFYAMLYRCIIWELARIFCVDKNDRELTNTEYTLDDHNDVKEVSLLLNFKKNKMSDFVRFLKDNEDFLPNELRAMFRLSVGYGYGNKEALLIDAKQIANISQVEFERENSDGSLTDKILDSRGYMALGRFSERLRDYFLQQTN